MMVPGVPPKVTVAVEKLAGFREMPLSNAADAYAAYAERSALKIVLRP